MDFLCTRPPVWPYLTLLSRGAGSLPSLAGSTPNAAQGAISLLCCKGTLLVHVQHGDQQVLSCKLLFCCVSHSMGLFLPRCRILHFFLLNFIKLWRLILVGRTEGIQYLSLFHIPCHQGPAPLCSRLYRRHSLDILLLSVYLHKFFMLPMMPLLTRWANDGRNLYIERIFMRSSVWHLQCYAQLGSKNVVSPTLIL